MNNSTSYNYGDTHIFTSRNPNPLIYLVPGSEETLIIDGSILGPLAGGKLTSGTILIGDINNVAQEQIVSGDAIITDNGVLTISDTSVIPGTYTNSTVTVNSQGRLTSASSGGIIPPGSLSLTDGHVYVGNSSNIASDVAMTGDISISDTGITTLANTSVTPGSYTLGSYTVNSQGRLTSGSSGVLNSGQIWIGNVSNVPTARTFIGDVTVDNLGGTVLNNTAITPGTYSGYSNSFVFNSQGRAIGVGAQTLSNNNFWLGNVSNVPTPVFIHGDATTSNDGTFTLSTVNSSPGVVTYPTSLTVNGKGLITATNNVLARDLFIMGNTSGFSSAFSLTGDLTNAINILTLNTVNSNVGTFGSSTQVPQLTVNGKGLITAVSNVSIGGISPIGSALNSGNIIVGSASNLAASVVMSNDAVIINTGAITLKTIVSAPDQGNYAYLSGNIDYAGRVSPNDAVCTTGKFLCGDTGNLVDQFSMTGDASLSGVTPGLLTLASVNVSSGSTTISSITTNAKGLVTSNTSGSFTGDISNTALAITVNKIKGVALGTTTATDKNLLIANGTSWNSAAMSGDATIGNTGVITLANSGASAATYNGYNNSFTVNAKGLITGTGSVTQQLMAVGSQSAPSYSFASNASTGIFCSATSSIGYSCNNVLKLQQGPKGAGGSENAMGNGCSLASPDGNGSVLTIRSIYPETGTVCVSDNATSHYQIEFFNPSGAGGSTVQVGYILTNGSVTIFSTTSDQTTKNNITNFSGGLAIVNNLKTRNFKWNSDGVSDIGLIAQEVLPYYPISVIQPAINSVKNPTMSIDYAHFPPLLVNAIQELNSTLQAQITSQAAQITALQAQVNAQQNSITTLTAHLGLVNAVLHLF